PIDEPLQVRIEDHEVGGSALAQPALQWLVNRRRLRSKSKNSPFDRQTLTGSVLRTIVSGQTVFTNDPPAEPGADG
ncbi:MAG: hypothetical protein AAFR28_16465, partial [Pseudomonadota bacterium]